MNYTEVVFTVHDPQLQEWLSAFLFEEGAESVEEHTTGISAYFSEHQFDLQKMKQLLLDFPAFQAISFTCRSLAPQNWNEVWEKSFEPVLVEGQVCIRAPFHKESSYPIEIIIEPKMSFGTGHHQTTYMMAALMLDYEWQNKHVLDFGSGTGVLAILSAHLGAAKILGIDNESWAVTNAIENAERNQLTSLLFREQDNPNFNDFTCHFLLANINRHVLICFMDDFFKLIFPGGFLIISGYLEADIQTIQDRASSSGFILVRTMEREGWIAQIFQKNTV